MTGATTPIGDAPAAQAEAAARQNDQSTIDFPYLDEDAAVDVAKNIYERAGLGECEIDELAAQMGVTVSGSFRLKNATAKLFGLIDKGARTSFRLSELGQRIVRPETEAEARSVAFLNIPLYKAIFDRYRGHLLPPTKALEREMIALGVAPKQADKARQAFGRSARQAGFFAQGEDRLVQPRFDREPATRPTEAADADTSSKAEARTGGGSGGRSDLHPFIQGLLAKLPAPESEWSTADQAKWLRTAVQIFGLIYKGDVSVIDVKIVEI